MKDLKTLIESNSDVQEIILNLSEASVLQQAKDMNKDPEARAKNLEAMMRKVKSRIKTIEGQAGSRKLTDEKYALQDMVKSLEKQLSTPIRKLKK